MVCPTKNGAWWSVDVGEFEFGLIEYGNGKSNSTRRREPEEEGRSAELKKDSRKCTTTLTNSKPGDEVAGGALARNTEPFKAGEIAGRKHGRQMKRDPDEMG